MRHVTRRGGANGQETGCVSRSAHGRGRLLIGLVLVALMAIAAVFATACRDDPWSGTWRGAFSDGLETVWVIERTDSGWAIVDSMGKRGAAVEKGDRLVAVGRYALKDMQFARDGEELVLWVDGHEVGRYVREQQ